MTTETIQSNLNHLLNTLRVDIFPTLLPEYQVANIEEVRNILKCSIVPRPTKRQLLTFLEVLISSDIDDEATRRIAITFDEWNNPPV